MEINIIVACDLNGIIGINGKIPWHIPEDLKRFKELTTGHPVIMGRKTWESLPVKPLPGRCNIIVTRGRSLREGAWLCEKLDGAISTAEALGYEKAYIIGGERLYRDAMPIADKVYLTAVLSEFEVKEGDEVARFPVDLIDNDGFELIVDDPGGKFDFNIYQRRK